MAEENTLSNPRPGWPSPASDRQAGWRGKQVFKGVAKRIARALSGRHMEVRGPSRNSSPRTRKDQLDLDQAGGAYQGVSLRQFIQDAHCLVWSPPHIREMIQAHNVNIIPADFYSTVPSVADIRSTFEGSENPIPVYDRIFDHSVISGFLDSIAPYSAEFAPPDEGEEESCREFFWKNSQFSWTDAMAYYCIVRQRRPRRIVEIGSGFSTLIADAAIRRNGCGEVISIEPYPRGFLADIPSVTDLIKEKIQDISVEKFTDLLSTADILFIDSTHTVKIGSDCLYIYLILLPAIAQEMLVHSHDVFLPFGMRADWALHRQIYWTEQYLLYAFLLNNPAARVLFGSTYAAEFLTSQVSDMMNGRCGIGGGSIWYSLN